MPTAFHGCMDALAHQNIEVFANYLCQLGGRLKGREKDNWYRTEKELNEIIFEEYPLKDSKKRKNR